MNRKKIDATLADPLRENEQAPTGTWHKATTPLSFTHRRIRVGMFTAYRRIEQPAPPVTPADDFQI
jgi:hypothetical protein